MPAAASLPDFGESALQKPALRLLFGQVKRPLVGGSGLRRPPQPAAKVGAGGVCESVVAEFATPKNRIDEDKTRSRSVAHGDRDGAVQFDDRRGAGALEVVVKPDDFRPVGRAGIRRARMNRRNGGLDGVRPGLGRGSGRRIRSPEVEVRATRRDSCNSISARSPMASDSGNGSTTSRPSSREVGNIALLERPPAAAEG